MLTDNEYLFYALALIAEIIGTVSGFGSSLLFVPIAALFFDFQTVLGITALFHVFSNITKIALFRSGVDKNIALKLGIPAVVFVILGALLSAYVPQKELELAMCVVLIALSLFLILYARKQLKQSNRNLVLGGAGSGFLAGLIGTGGALRGITLAAFGLPKEIFIATSALIDLGVDASRTVVYYFNGYLRYEILWMVPFLLGISILGNWIGKQILDHIPQKLFRFVVLGIIVITSVLQLIRYFAGYEAS